MIWADYTDEINILHFKTFISNPSDEDADYRTYMIEEGFSNINNDCETKITKKYEFKKMKKITDLYTYFTEDILFQVKLDKNVDIMEFLKDYKTIFNGRETQEELGISY